MRIYLKLICAIFFISVALAENPPPRISDEGGTKAPYFNLDCVGGGITCTTSGINATVTVSTPTPVATPPLQDVTTAGATSNVLTTFSGGLYSRGAGTNSTRLGGVTATAGGTSSIAIGDTVDAQGLYDIVIGKDGISKNTAGGTISANIGIGYFIDIDNFDVTPNFSGNTGLGNGIIIRGYDNSVFGRIMTVASSATVLADQGNENTLFGVQILSGLRASQSTAIGNTITIANDSSNTIAIGRALTANHANTVLVGAGLTSTSANDFQLGTSSHLYKFAGVFPDNSSIDLGTGRDAKILYDGTNLVINPLAVGTGYVWIGDGSTTPPTGKLRAYTIGLGDSAPANVRPLTLDSTGGTLSAGIAGTINYTGATITMRAMLFDAQHAGTSTTQNKIAVGGNFTGSLAVDTTGTVQMFGVNSTARSTVALANTSGAGSYAFSNKFQVTSVGGNTATQPIYAYSVWALDPNAFTGASTVNKWAGMFEGDTQILSDKKLLLEGSSTVKGDSYFIFNSASTDIDNYVDAVKTQTWDNDWIDLFLPTTVAANFGVASGSTVGFEDVSGTAGDTNLKYTASVLRGTVDNVAVVDWDNALPETLTQATNDTTVHSKITTATNDDPTDNFRQGRIATTDATVTTINTVVTANDTSVLIECRVTARRTGGSAGTAGDVGGYVHRCNYKNIAAALTEIADTTDYAGESQAGWAVTCAPSGANILVQVTGATNNNVTWHSHCDIYSVGT